MSGINLHFPQDLTEALGLLQELEGARILAGGTDLLVDYKQGLIQIHHLISLQELKELKEIENKNANIRIGTMATALEIISHPLINEHIPALVEVARAMASSHIRSLATIGGNIASGVPSADFPPTLIAADAIVELRCSQSRREISLLEFFTGPRETVCREEEMLTAILIPVPPPKTRPRYIAESSNPVSQKDPTGPKRWVRVRIYLFWRLSPMPSPMQPACGLKISLSPQKRY